jgi:hypothetical protein
MEKPNIHHVRYHARKHHEAHLRLKELLQYPILHERVWHIFVTTFFIALVTIMIFLNWGGIMNFFVSTPANELPQVHGFQSGALSNYKVDYQAGDIYRRYMAAIPSQGHLTGIQAVKAIGEKETEPMAFEEGALKNSVWLTNMLSTGQHLTRLEQERAGSFQKSVLATYYLGEKTIDINSTLQTDTQILSQIDNALSVDLFQYLNQSESRADSLSNYLNLLNILLEKCNDRINDLQVKIDFLNANFASQEVQIKSSEQVFFDNLMMFQGDNAEEELGKFIGVQEAQVEVRAKIGAYKSLRDYYKFFQPKLDNLIRAIKANRDPLIAGVKVVEIQNMTLPLIIKER